jgi:hypothetical protein
MIKALKKITNLIHNVIQCNTLNRIKIIQTLLIHTLELALINTSPTTTGIFKKLKSRGSTLFSVQSVKMPKTLMVKGFSFIC